MVSSHSQTVTRLTAGRTLICRIPLNRSPASFPSFGVYVGTTNNLPERTYEHARGVMSNEANEEFGKTNQYKISRLLRKLEGHEYRTFRLMSFYESSPLLNFTNGRELAEQCMVLCFDSINPKVVQRNLTNQTMGGDAQRTEAIARDETVGIANALR